MTQMAMNECFEKIRFSFMKKLVAFSDQYSGDGWV